MGFIINNQDYSNPVFYKVTTSGLTHCPKISFSVALKDSAAIAPMQSLLHENNIFFVTCLEDDKSISTNFGMLKQYGNCYCIHITPEELNISNACKLLLNDKDNILNLCYRSEGKLKNELQNILNGVEEKLSLDSRYNSHKYCLIL